MRTGIAVLSLMLCACGTAADGIAVPEYVYEVIHTYPHDPEAFTQGLFYLDGFLYEGTGLRGQSQIRKVRLETGEVLQRRDLPAASFGEGIVNWKSTLVELTWQAESGYRYDLATFAPKDDFHYPGEGWGLTQDGTRIIMSDGTAQLRFWDPESLSETGRISVTDAYGNAVPMLNELEWIGGEIYANVWHTDRIARIDPKTGKVAAWIDLTGLWPGSDLQEKTLNGIAYDAQHQRLFVTGKLWPKLSRSDY
jgi:glutaminyl-peptide cyclotransferase